MGLNLNSLKSQICRYLCCAFVSLLINRKLFLKAFLKYFQSILKYLKYFLKVFVFVFQILCWKSICICILNTFWEEYLYLYFKYFSKVFYPGVQWTYLSLFFWKRMGENKSPKGWGTRVQDLSPWWSPPNWDHVGPFKPILNRHGFNPIFLRFKYKS